MRQLLWGALGLLCAACTSPNAHLGDAYRPVIIEAGGEASRYEVDRQACEASVQRLPTNYEPNNVIRFRQCLVDKGYKLLS